MPQTHQTKRAAAKDKRSGLKGWEPAKVKANNNAVYEKLLVVERTLTTEVVEAGSGAGGEAGEAGEQGGEGGKRGKGGKAAKANDAAEAVTRTVTTVLSEAAGDCPIVMDAPKRADVMRATVAADLQSCDAPFEVLPFVETDYRAEAARRDDPLAPSTCEAAADEAGAYSFWLGGQRIS